MKSTLVSIAWAMLWVLFCAAPLRAEGDYVHVFTGFTFPPKVAAFALTKITPYNDAKSDIEVDYDNNPFTVHASVYVYPASDPLKQHYEQCKAGVVTVHPDAKLLEEKPISLNKSGVDYRGFGALFAFRYNFAGKDDQELLSRLWVFRRGNYYVLYRISYLRGDKGAAEKEIDDFIRQLSWPTGHDHAESGI